MPEKTTYTHLRKVERHEIALLRAKGYSIRDIARALGRSPNTISNELKRGVRKRVYNPKKAHHKARMRRKYSKYQGMQVIQHQQLRAYVDTKLQDGWSPAQIAGRIRVAETHLPLVGKDAVYKYVASAHGARFRRHLRRKGKRPGRRRVVAKAKLQERTFIDDRPNIVDRRSRIGDWEGDFIVSGKSGSGTLLVLHERTSRLVLLRLLIRPDTVAVNTAVAEMLSDMPLYTLTLDNDILLQKHQALSYIIGAPIFFCHPYASWEKGAVENSNGLIRQYLPKGCDLSAYDDQKIWAFQERLNHRPRKCLGYKTPYEVFTGSAVSNVEMQYPVSVQLKKPRRGVVECPT
jgi:transposase, IS30 family